MKTRGIFRAIIGAVAALIGGVRPAGEERRNRAPGQRSHARGKKPTRGAFGRGPTGWHDK